MGSKPSIYELWICIQDAKLVRMRTVTVPPVSQNKACKHARCSYLLNVAIHTHAVIQVAAVLKRSDFRNVESPLEGLAVGWKVQPCTTKVRDHLEKLLKVSDLCVTINQSTLSAFEWKAHFCFCPKVVLELLTLVKIASCCSPYTNSGCCFVFTLRSEIRKVPLETKP